VRGRDFGYIGDSTGNGYKRTLFGQALTDFFHTHEQARTAHTQRRRARHSAGRACHGRQRAVIGSEALELTYKSPNGKVANELLYRHDEERIEVVELGRPWSFDGDGGLFRLVSEAHRIHLAHLFDPVLAVHTSIVEPLLSTVAHCRRE
jgi:hypothetical protein